MLPLLLLSCVAAVPTAIATDVSLLPLFEHDDDASLFLVLLLLRLQLTLRTAAAAAAAAAAVLHEMHCTRNVRKPSLRPPLNPLAMTIPSSFACFTKHARPARATRHQDMEPEYIAVGEYSQKAYVTLQARRGRTRNQPR